MAALFPSWPGLLAPASSFVGRPLPVASGPVLAVWVAGVAAAAGLVALAELRFRRLARTGRAGPAVMGVYWPRVVTPADYADRFTPGERALIARHEHMHIARRDPGANLLTAGLQALAWFNPLAHLAARCARLDQELACDAMVIEAWPDCRRAYGATLIKAHMAAPRSPFACAWPAAGRHPLELRLKMLARPRLELAQYLKGAAAVGAVIVAVVAAMWLAFPGY
jgi:beta-lactamase regulating signal transducer with metallopeptidase domain